VSIVGHSPYSAVAGGAWSEFRGFKRGKNFPCSNHCIEHLLATGMERLAHCENARQRVGFVRPRIIVVVVSHHARTYEARHFRSCCYAVSPDGGLESASRI